jgi:methyltransferase (TIGR00027 family)
MDEEFGAGFSGSALFAAAARAAHLIVDKEPYIFADTLAVALLGDQAAELVSLHRLHGDHVLLCRARTQVACRSRYAEDRLDAAAGRGVRQYVILGAGLDTFAYRSQLAGAVRVIEVDHPATQDWKRRALAAAGIAVPSGVAFVPADLTADDLGEVLRRAPLDLASPVFVSWLGVVMYLAPADVTATLTTLGGLAPGTEVVADYLLAPGLRDEAGRAYAELMATASAEHGSRGCRPPSRRRSRRWRRPPASGRSGTRASGTRSRPPSRIGITRSHQRRCSPCFTRRKRDSVRVHCRRARGMPCRSAPGRLPWKARAAPAGGHFTGNGGA